MGKKKEYMDWKLFIAQRIYRSQEGQKEVSKPAIRIATLGIAIGLAVMLVTVAVVLGFQHGVRDKVVGLGSDILVTNLSAHQSYETVPIEVDETLQKKLQQMKGVNHAQRYATKPGMIMTDYDFLGMMLKGVGQEYDWDFLRRHLLEGQIPEFTDSTSSNKVLVSQTIAHKLHLQLHDKINTYFIDGEKVRARRFQIAGIYQTNFSMYDDHFLITDLHTLIRLNHWEKGQVSGIEMELMDYNQLITVKDNLVSDLDGKTDKYGRNYFVQTVEEANPQIFGWLSVLDMNVWVILILMTGVAGFTMISGLLIITLERTNMIGILKAMGADNGAIRSIFLRFSVFLIGKGMLWGNVIGLSFCLLQSHFRWLKLDPVTYYVDSVPVEIHFGLIFLLNICTLLVSVLMLIGPSYLITRIHPATAIRFE